MDAFGHTESGAKRVVAAVRGFENMAGDRGYGPLDPGDDGPLPLVKVSANDPSTGEITVREIESDGTDLPGGRVWDGSALPKVVAASGVPWAPLGSVWEVRQLVNPAVAGSTRPVIAGVQPFQTFTVYLEEAGGADGDATSAPTWTYDVRGDVPTTGPLLASAYQPTSDTAFARLIPNGYDRSATQGIGYYDDSGTFILIWANEGFSDTADCS